VGRDILGARKGDNVGSWTPVLQHGLGEDNEVGTVDTVGVLEAGQEGSRWL
jgi:hypothetical protein